MDKFKEFDVAFKKDIKHFDAELNKCLGEGLSKQEKKQVYAEYGKLKRASI